MCSEASPHGDAQSRIRKVAESITAIHQRSIAVYPTPAYAVQASYKSAYRGTGPARGPVHTNTQLGMVQLRLTTVSGNAMIRHFPSQGYLGLTPVHVEGVVQVTIEADQKPVPARRLTVSVRAYESRRIGDSQTRMALEYSQTLWSRPLDQPHAELGEFQSPFKITLPKDVTGFSTANYQDYRTYWRVEATLEQATKGKSESGITKHIDLLLTRHDVPCPLIPAPPPQGPHLDPALPLQTTKPRAPVLHYNISTPTHAIGPSDLLFTSVFIRPADTSVKLRSASLLVERRLVLFDVDRPSSPPGNRSQVNASPRTEADDDDRDVFAYGAVWCPSPSIPSGLPVFPYPSPPTSSEGASREKTVTSTVAAAQSAAFSHDRETDVWTKTISLAWPASKSQSRWSVGETVTGALGAVSFWIKVKVIVTSPSGTESIDLQPREILVVLTSDHQRRRALEASGARAEYLPPPYTAPAPASVRPRPAAAVPEWGVAMGSRLPMTLTPNGAPRTAGAATISPQVNPPPITRTRNGLKATLTKVFRRKKTREGP